MDKTKLDALNAAIEKAEELNKEARGLLEQAINSAGHDLELATDYRLSYANRVLAACARVQNVTDKYYLARLKKKRTVRAE